MYNITLTETELQIVQHALLAHKLTIPNIGEVNKQRKKDVQTVEVAIYDQTKVSRVF